MSKVNEIELVKKEAKEIVVDSNIVTPMSMLQSAREQGASIEQMQQLMDMQFKWEANEARKAYFAAVSSFKSVPLKITKDKDNKQYGSRYTSIGNLVNTTNAELSKFALSAQWNIDQSNGITVTCILSHSLGHSEQVSMTAPPDKSGSKNPIQEIKSTITYLKVATYEAVVGVASSDDPSDTDGNKEPVYISSKQIADIESLMVEVSADKNNFLKYLKIDKLENLPLTKFNQAIKALEDKRK